MCHVTEAPSDPTNTPWAGLNYPTDMTTLCPTGPNDSAALGQLAESVQRLTGLTGIAALAAAVLIDQGRVEDAFGLIQKAAAEAADELEARKQRALERSRAAS